MMYAGEMRWTVSWMVSLIPKHSDFATSTGDAVPFYMMPKHFHCLDARKLNTRISHRYVNALPTAIHSPIFSLTYRTGNPIAERIQEDWKSVAAPGIVPNVKNIS